MFKNYLKTAYRNLIRNKVFSLINIIGLAIGISAALVIFLIVQFDFNFDKFEKNRNNIFRVVSNFTFSGTPYKNSGVPGPMGKAVSKELTGLASVIPFIYGDDDTKLSVPANGSAPIKHFKKQKSLVFADSRYMSMLGYTWLAGSSKTALSAPYQIVLTTSNAKLFYGNIKPADLIGKKLVYNDTVTATITGIVQDLVGQTDFTFKTIISLSTMETPRMQPEYTNTWDNVNSSTQLFIIKSPAISNSNIEKQIDALHHKYNKPQVDDHSTVEYKLQPFEMVHFDADYGNFDQRIAHKPTLYGLLSVAAFLLLLGCINFINLTTAQASQRSKEIGIRKTMGSTRKQLVLQFLSETLALTFLATVLSILLTPILLKIFHDFIPEGLHFELTGFIVLFLLGLLIAISFLAGFYPAIVLSSFKPVDVLKNQVIDLRGKSRSVWLRKSLTVAQFVIAQVFIIATLFVGKQISHSLNSDLGFTKEAILIFRIKYNDTATSKKNYFFDALKRIPEVKEVSLSTNPPSSSGTWTSTMKYMDGKKEIVTNPHVKMIDTQYLKLFHIPLLAGTNLVPSDTVNGLLINEAYSSFLGFKKPSDAIGKIIEWQDRQQPIIGVVANFHQKSLHEKIAPLIMGMNKNQARVFSVALQPQNAEGTRWKSAIDKIQNLWKQQYPEEDFNYEFLDETIAKYYKSEQKISRLLSWATGLTIFISCLGLLGLVSFVTNQRTKEIGVRKVLGASVTQIITLLSLDFLLLVLIAFFIAIPIAWWGVHKWLENFAYKISINFWLFLEGGLLLFCLSMLILGIKTYQAASANPVTSLRSE